MKKLLLVTAIVSLFACRKEPVPPVVTGPGSIEYKVNGGPVKIQDTDLDTFVTITKQSTYILNARRGDYDAIYLTFLTDSLQVKNYHYDNSNSSLFDVFYNGEVSYVILEGDYIDINITGYTNSRITGTFTGKFTPLTDHGYGEPGSIVVTEGKMNNIEVIY